MPCPDIHLIGSANVNALSNMEKKIKQEGKVDYFCNWIFFWIKWFHPLYISDFRDGGGGPVSFIL